MEPRGRPLSALSGSPSSKYLLPVLHLNRPSHPWLQPFGAAAEAEPWAGREIRDLL